MIIQEYYNFADYSEFEKFWIFAVLCNNILNRKDLIDILKHFKIRFLEDNWEERTSLKEMGLTIGGDIKRNDLLPYMQNYIKEKYPKIFSFEEAEKLYNILMNINSTIDITRLWICIEKNSPYLEIAKEKLKIFEESNSDKKQIEKDKYYKNIVEEIIISLYKLAMKNN